MSISEKESGNKKSICLADCVKPHKIRYPAFRVPRLLTWVSKEGARSVTQLNASRTRKAFQEGHTMVLPAKKYQKK